MKNIFCILIMLFGITPAMADSTFGQPNIAEPSAEDLRFIHEHVLPKEFHALSSKISLEEIFRMRPTMDKEGDRGSRGRDYLETISKVNLYRNLEIQKDSKGVHNIAFTGAFLTPNSEQIERTVSWLLIIKGEPDEVFTRDLSPNSPGDEAIIVVWKGQDQTVGLSFHFGSDLHSRLVVARVGVSTNEIFSASGRREKSTKPADVRSLIAAWISLITTPRDGKRANQE